MTDTTQATPAELLTIELAYDGETFIGYRLTARGSPVLVFASDTMPGFRVGSAFTTDIGHTIRYERAAIGSMPASIWPGRTLFDRFGILLDDTCTFLSEAAQEERERGNDSTADGREAQAFAMKELIRILLASPPAAPAPTQPPQKAGAPYGIIDPDYARAFTIIRCWAWSYGYAVGMHGSFTRDLDLILAPWTDNAAPPEPLINLLAEHTGTRLQSKEPGIKPHGRRSWTLLLPGFGDPRWIDVSVMPKASPSPELTEEQERAAFEAEIAKNCGDLSKFGSGRNVHYRNSAVNNAWGGWKARAALAQLGRST